MNARSSSLGTMSVMMTPQQGEAGDGSTGVFERQTILGDRGLRYAKSFGSRCVAERPMPNDRFWPLADCRRRPLPTLSSRPNFPEADGQQINLIDSCGEHPNPFQRNDS